MQQWTVYSPQVPQCIFKKYTYYKNIKCIHYSKKCNTAVDCKDKSDEQYCDYLRIPPNYGKELIPNEDPKVPLIVYLNVSVLAFPEIKTTELTFTSDYFLNLRWYDPRLAFQDLNNLTALNILSSKHKSQIWTPQLTFTNALGPFQTEVDKLTSGVLIREAPPLKEDISLATEGNPITYLLDTSLKKHLKIINFLQHYFFLGQKIPLESEENITRVMGVDSNSFTTHLIHKCVKWSLKCKAKPTNTSRCKKMDTAWNFWVT